MARALLQRVGHLCFEGVSSSTLGQGQGLGTTPQGQGLGAAQGPGLGQAVVSAQSLGNSGVDVSGMGSGGGSRGSTGGSVLHYAVLGRSLPCVHLLVR